MHHTPLHSSTPSLITGIESHLLSPFVFPFLSSLWLIKSPALWYTANLSGRFNELLGPPFLPPPQFFHKKKWTIQHPFTHTTFPKGSFFSFFFVFKLGHFMSSDFYLVFFGKQKRLNGYSSWREREIPVHLPACGLLVVNFSRPFIRSD